MVARINPPIRWMVGGVEVSSTFLRHDLRYGSSARIATGLPIHLEGANGYLVLDDNDGSNFARPGGEAELTIGGLLAWRGRAQRIDPFTVPERREALFRLDSRWGARLAESGEVLLTDQADILAIGRGIADAMDIGSEWYSFGADFSGQGGAALIHWRPERSWAQLWTALGIHAGGFAVENNFGQILITALRTDTIDTAIDLGVQFQPLVGSVLAPRPTMACSGVRIDAIDGVVDPTTPLASFPITIPSGGQFILSWRNPQSQSSVIVTLLTPTAPGVTFTPIEENPQGGSWTVSGPPGNHTVTIRGQRQFLVGLDRRVVNIADAGADSRPLPAPPWGTVPLPTAPAAANLAVSLGNTPVWMHARYDLHTPSQNELERLLAVTPGTVVRAGVGDATATVLVLGINLHANTDQLSTIEVIGIGYGISRPPGVGVQPAAICPPPTVTANSDRTVTVTLPTAANRRVRARWISSAIRPIPQAWTQGALQAQGATSFKTPALAPGEYLVSIQCVDGTTIGGWSGPTKVTIDDDNCPPASAPLGLPLEGGQEYLTLAMDDNFIWAAPSAIANDRTVRAFSRAPNFPEATAQEFELPVGLPRPRFVGKLGNVFILGDASGATRAVSPDNTPVLIPFVGANQPIVAGAITSRWYVLATYAGAISDGRNHSLRFYHRATYQVPLASVSLQMPQGEVPSGIAVNPAETALYAITRAGTVHEYPFSGGTIGERKQIATVAANLSSGEQCTGLACPDGANLWTLFSKATSPRSSKLACIPIPEPVPEAPTLVFREANITLGDILEDPVGINKIGSGDDEVWVITESGGGTNFRVYIYKVSDGSFVRFVIPGFNRIGFQSCTTPMGFLRGSTQQVANLFVGTGSDNNRTWFWRGIDLDGKNLRTIGSQKTIRASKFKLASVGNPGWDQVAMSLIFVGTVSGDVQESQHLVRDDADNVTWNTGLPVETEQIVGITFDRTQDEMILVTAKPEIRRYSMDRTKTPPVPTFEQAYDVSDHFTNLRGCYWESGRLYLIEESMTGDGPFVMYLVWPPS